MESPGSVNKFTGAYGNNPRRGYFHRRTFLIRQFQMAFFKMVSFSTDARNRPIKSCPEYFVILWYSG